MRACRALEGIPAGAHFLRRLRLRRRCRQRRAGRRKIFGAKIADGEITASDECDAEKNNKNEEDETALREPAESLLRRRRLDPCLVRHRDLSLSIFTCASIRDRKSTRLNSSHVS